MYRVVINVDLLTFERETRSGVLSNIVGYHYYKGKY